MTLINSAFINKSIENLTIQIVISNTCLFNFCQVDYHPLHVTHNLASTAWKVSKYGVFSGPYFPTFGLNTERYEKCPNTEFFPGRFVGAFRLNMDRHEKCLKIQTRTNSVPYLNTCIFGHLVFGYFSHNDQKSKFEWNAYAKKTDNTVSFFWHCQSVLYRWIYYRWYWCHLACWWCAKCERCFSPQAVVQRCSVKKVFLEISQSSYIGKHLCQSLFFNKVAGIRLNVVLALNQYNTRFSNIHNVQLHTNI